MTKNDPLAPRHYKDLGPHEPWDVVECWIEANPFFLENAKLGFAYGNTIKYLARFGLKGSTLDDLQKARIYLDRMIAKIKAQETTE